MNARAQESEMVVETRTCCLHEPAIICEKKR